MTKVGEHITLDIIGTTQEHDSSIFEKVIYKIRKNKIYNYFIAFVLIGLSINLINMIK